MTFKDIFLLPNLITLTRFFGSLFLFSQFEALDFSVLYLIVIIAIIGLSDSLDGIVARRFSLVSKDCCIEAFIIANQFCGSGLVSIIAC